jgi:hypothetical protein
MTPHPLTNCSNRRARTHAVQQWRWATKMRTMLSLLLFLFSLCLLASQTQGAEFTIDPADIDPKFSEPQWTETEFSAIPKGKEMIVRMSTEDLIKVFWEKNSDRYDEEKAHFEMKEERAIRSGGAYYRRLLMYITDLRERSDHGYCGEYIAVWFVPSGSVQQFYFSERMCPL